MSDKLPEGDNTSTIDPIERSYQDLKKKIESNKKLSDFADSISGTLKKVLSDPIKGQVLSDFLNNPQVFENNPLQYSKLIDLIGVPAEWIEEFKTADDDTIDSWSPEKTKAYNRWLRKQGEVLDAANQKIEGQKADKLAANQKIEGQKAEQLKRQEEDVQKINAILPELEKNLPKEEESRIQEFIKANTNNPIYQIHAQLPAEEKVKYLRAVYFIEKGEEIRARLVTQYKDDPKKEAILKNFDAQLSELRKLDIVRQTSTKSFANNFPPTPATETAIAQAEKYEKTHTVYRDGTSLYFVNKSDPKDIKKIEIYADRAVLTVSKNGLSLSKDMALLSREDTEKRREKRKLGEEYEGKQKESSIAANEFWNVRRNEYEKPSYTSTLLVEHKAQQNEYEKLEIRLAQETLKPKEKLEIIRSMKRISTEMRDKKSEGIDPDNTEKLNLYSDVKSLLEERVRSLGRLEEKILKEGEILDKLSDKKFNDIKNIDESGWEKKAKSIISEITSDNYGYNGLSQESFDRLIEGLKIAKPDFWKNGFAFDDPVMQDIQLRELRSIADEKARDATGSSRVGWQNVQKNIQIEGSRLNSLWSNPNPEKLGNWAYEKKGEKPPEKPTEALK